MHGFFYFALFNAHDGAIWVDFYNLQILVQTPLPSQVDFLQILKEKGISIQDLEISSHCSDLQIELDEYAAPLIFSFAKTRHFILMVVSDVQITSIFPLLEKTVQDFDFEFRNPVDIVTGAGEIKTTKTTETPLTASEIRSRSILIISQDRRRHGSSTYF